MNLAHANFDLKIFQDGESPAKLIKYRALREADTFLRQTCSYDHGLGLFCGPRQSGKMTAIRSFVDRLPDDCSAGIVDGANLEVQDFLLAVLRSFGFELEASSANVLLNLIKVFVVRQTTAHKAPLLVIRNLSRMKPVTLHTVCQLAQVKVSSQSALRMILVSDGPLDRMISAPELGAIRSRKTGEHELGPMTRAETAYYVDAKLRHAGVKKPESVISPRIADDVHDESGGRPGLIDKCVVKRLTAAQERPRFVLTKDGETLATINLTDKRVLIGRADSNDVVIKSTFVSRHHIMLARENGATVLTDLNSTNGTCVNSRKVNVRGLRDNDVISFGDFRIKLLDPSSRQRPNVDDPSLADTSTMLALDDIRRRYESDKLKTKMVEVS